MSFTFDGVGLIHFQRRRQRSSLSTVLRENDNSVQRDKFTAVKSNTKKKKRSIFV